MRKQNVVNVKAENYGEIKTFAVIIFIISNFNDDFDSFFNASRTLLSKLCSIVDREIFISLNRSQEPKKILIFLF